MLFLTCQVLGLLVNTVGANEKNPVFNKENLMIPIQMILSQKQKTFSEFFARFLKHTINFEDLEKQHDSHRFCISEITDYEKAVR